jgi:hypothetical protein
VEETEGFSEAVTLVEAETVEAWKVGAAAAGV